MNYKTIRKMYGLTLDDVAKACGVTRQNVCKFENGHYKSSVCEEIYGRLGELHEKKYGTIAVMEWPESINLKKEVL